MVEREWVNTGDQVLVENPPDNIPDYDPRSGAHLWAVFTMYRVDPAQWSDPTHTPMLDRENLLTVQGPGCFYCEQVYSPRVASRRCKGQP